LPFHSFPLSNQHFKAVFSDEKEAPSDNMPRPPHRHNNATAAQLQVPRVNREAPIIDSTQRFAADTAH